MAVCAAVQIDTSLIEAADEGEAADGEGAMESDEEGEQANASAKRKAGTPVIEMVRCQAHDCQIGHVLVSY